MLLSSQRERLQVVLVSPRNPLNMGAAARAMANFGFPGLTVVAPYEPHWREACSAVGAEELLRGARRTESLREAVAGCALVAGTGTLTYRRPEQPVVRLPDLRALVEGALSAPESRVALVFGPEKHGLTREDLSWCHRLVEIPTDAAQPSMNLGQAVAVCLYELAVRGASSGPLSAPVPARGGPASSERLDLLAGVVAETLALAEYSPQAMRAANLHDLRLMLRRLAIGEADLRRLLGAFRRIQWRLRRAPRPDKKVSGGR